MNAPALELGPIRLAIASVGRGAMHICRDIGGIVALSAQVLSRLVRLRLDRRELVANLYAMGNGSLGIVCLTAFFVGGLMIIQAGIFVEKFSATSLVGWGAGYTIFRELGPVLIALMFSGRVGSNNTAELGTMTVTEQLDGLRALAIDPISYLIVPRVVAMAVMLLVLTIIGDFVAIVGGTLMSTLILGLEPQTFYYSLIDNLGWMDFIHGLIKAAVFGTTIALTSCYFGISVRGGAVGVGRAVNGAVVAAAVSILLFDFILTAVIP